LGTAFFIAAFFTTAFYTTAFFAGAFFVTNLIDFFVAMILVFIFNF